MKFDHKIILCNNDDIVSFSVELEQEWVYSLLKRFKVDPTVIKSYEEDPHFLKRKWREFLFDNYGIQIEKELATGKVTVKRLNFTTSEQIELGVWNAPEVVRVRNKHENHCELHLKYWQIV